MKTKSPIGPDGTVKVEIDTSVAKAAYGDRGSQVHHLRGSHGRQPPHHRRHRQRAGRATTLQSLCVGGSRLLHRRRHRHRAFHFARPSITNPSPEPAPSNSIKSPTTPRRSPSKTKSSTGASNPSDDGTADVQIHGQAAGQYRLSYTRHRRQRPDDRGRICLRRPRRGFQRQGVPLQRYRSRHGQKGICRRGKGAADGQHEPRRCDGAAVHSARPMAFICPRR